MPSISRVRLILLTLGGLLTVLLLWRRWASPSTLCVPKRRLALVLGDSDVSVAMVTRLLEVHSEVTLLRPHIDVNATLLGDEPRFTLPEQPSSSSYVSMRVANGLQMALQRNATLVCDALRRAVHEVAGSDDGCLVRVSLLNAVQNPLIAISEQYDVNMRDESAAAVRVALDRAVDQWLTDQRAIDWLHNCAGAGVDRFDLPVPRLLAHARDELRRFCAHFGVACDEQWLAASATMAEREFGALSGASVTIAPFNDAQFQRVYSVLRNHDALFVFAQEFHRRMLGGSDDKKPSKKPKALKLPSVCSAAQRVRASLPGLRPNQRHLDAVTRKALSKQVLVFFCDTKHLEGIALYSRWFEHVLCPSHDASDEEFDSLPKLPIWWVRDKHWRWLGYIRRRIERDPKFVPPLIMFGALHHSLFCEESERIFGVALETTVEDLAAAIVVFTHVESGALDRHCIERGVSPHLRSVPWVDQGVDPATLAQRRIDCSRWQAPPLSTESHNARALSVFSGGYSDRDFVTLIDAVERVDGAILRLFFDPAKYLAPNLQSVLSHCTATPSKCSIVSNATREAYLEAMHCHDVIAVSLNPTNIKGAGVQKLQSGETTLIEAIMTGQYVLATTRRPGEWHQYVPHEQTVNAGDVSAWRRALNELAANEDTLPSRTAFWRLQTTEFTMENMVNGVLDVLAQSMFDFCTE